MKLRELLHDIVDVNFDVEIKGVTCNPKRVKEGYLFVCVSAVSFQRVTLESRKPACIQIFPTESQYHAHDCVDVVIQGTKKDVIPVLDYLDPENLIANEHTRQLYNKNWIPVGFVA